MGPIQCFRAAPYDMPIGDRIILCQTAENDMAAQCTKEAPYHFSPHELVLFSCNSIKN